MGEAANFERICSVCGAKQDLNAKRCVACGADLDTSADTSGRFVDEDPTLLHVDPNNRVQLDRFPRLDQAELACGYLRSNNVACEISSMVIPGLPTDLILWVNTRDAELAWALLADMEFRAQKRNDDVA